MQEQGYVRHRGRYITIEEKELLDKSSAEVAAERDWYRRVHLLRRALSGRETQREKALNELRAIRDPDAVFGLAKHFQDEPNEKLRILYVRILSAIRSEKAVEKLVAQSLRDVSSLVRAESVDGIQPNDQALAASLYLAELLDPTNVVVRRSAAALARFGNESVVPGLIDALVTTHRYKVRVADNRNAMSFGSDGSFSLGGNTQAVIPPEIAMG